MDELYKRMHEVKKQSEPNDLAWVALFYQYYMTNGQCHIGPIGSLDNNNNKYPAVKRETLEDFFKRIPLEELNGAYGKAGDE